MKRPTLNFLVDALSCAALVLVTATGFLLRYVLPPGSGGRVGHGTGPSAAARVIATVWSFTRHEWGAIHFWLAVALMAMLALHLALHGRWIVALVRGQPRPGYNPRVFLGVFGLVVLVLVALWPLLTTVVRTPRFELGN